MKPVMTGPIPGENYTSDTKNYPWHRPPEYTNLDKAIEASIEKLMDDETSDSLVTMLELGVDVVTLTDMFVTSGIGAGKWTPDFALLIAGPVSDIICLMAEGYDIPYELGIEKKSKSPSSAFYKESAKINEAAELIEEALPGEPVEERKTGGFMGMTKSVSTNDAPITPTQNEEQY